MGGEMGTEGNGDGPFVSVPLLIHETGGRKQKDRPLSPVKQGDRNKRTVPYLPVHGH